MIRFWMKSLVLLITTLLIFTSCETVDTVPVVTELSAEEKKEVELSLKRAWSDLFAGEYSDADTNLTTLLETLPQNISEKGDIYRTLAMASYLMTDSAEPFHLLTLAAEADLSSPLTLSALTLALEETLYNSDMHYNLIEILEKAAADNSLPHWLQREYQYLIFDYYYSKRGYLSRVTTLKEEMQILYDWEIIGPFSNISGSGFNRDYLMTDPETGLTEPAPGLKNWEITPYTPYIKNKALLEPLSAYFEQEDYISVYAHKEVNITEAGFYEMVFSRDGTLEVWIDEEKILMDENYTRGRNAFYIQKELSAGPHRILVKSSKRQGNAGFNMALYKSHSTYSESSLYRELFLEINTLDPLINSLCFQAEEGSREALFWLTWTLMHKGWTEQARTLLLRDFQSDNTLDSWLWTLFYKKSGDRITFKQRVLKLAEREEPFTPAMRYAGFDYLINSRYARADEFISSMEESYYSLYLKLVYELLTEDSSQALKTYDIIKNRYKGFVMEDRALLLYSEELSENQRMLSVRNILSKGDYEKDFLFEIDLMQRNGQGIDAVKNKYYTWLSKYSINEDGWLRYLNTLFTVANVTEFRNQMDRVLNTFPLSYGLLDISKEFSGAAWKDLSEFKEENREKLLLYPSALADLDDRISQEKKAYDEVLNTIMNYYPYNLETRDEWREAQGKERFLDSVVPEDSYDIIEDFEKSEWDPGYHDVVIVYDKTHDLYFGDGASSHIRHVIRKVMTPSGIEASRYVDLGFYLSQTGQLYDAYTHKKDGRRIPAQLSGRELAFTNISEGDYIVFSFRVEDYWDSIIHQEIYKTVNLQSAYPVYNKEVNLIYPKGYELNYQYNNISEEHAGKNESDFLEDYTKMTFSINKKEALQLSGFLPDWRDVAPSVDISSLKEWDQIITWYEGLYLGQTEDTWLIRQKALELTKESETREDKIRKIFDFVANKVEYENLAFQRDGYIPQTAESVLKEGFGDCKDQSVLLIALLKAVGIESHMVLNATYYTGDNVFLPSEIFDHVFVAVPRGEDTLFLDPTLTYLTYGEMPADRDGSYVLEVKEGGGFYKTDYSIEEQKSFSVLELHNLFGNTEVKGSVVYQGDNAWGVRTLFKDRSEKAQRRVFSESMYWIPGFHLGELNLDNMDNIISDPAVTFTGDITPPVVQVKKNLYRVNAPWRGDIKTEAKLWLAALPSENGLRVAGRRVAAPASQVIILNLPKGASVYSLPESRTLRFKESYIRYSFEKSGNQIICEKEVYIPYQTVKGEDLSEFHAFLREALALETQEIYINR